jgi:hypothetical protein
MKCIILLLFTLLPIKMIIGFEKLNAQPAPHFLDAEEWSWTKGNKAASRGTTWQFFKDQTFKAVDWYSGGAYWTYKYKGTYHYDMATKTVYLRYTKDKTLPVMKTNLCIRIMENGSGGYDPVFYDNWKKQNHKYIALGTPKVKSLQTEKRNDTKNETLDLNYSEHFMIKKIPQD